VLCKCTKSMANDVNKDRRLELGLGLGLGLGPVLGFLQSLLLY